jgi:hypothetical protein
MRFREIEWKRFNGSAKRIGSLRRIRECDHLVCSASRRWAMYLPEKPKAPVTAIRTLASHQAGMWRAGWNLLRLDVGGPDHLAPCFEFCRDSPGEFLWRASDRVIAEGHQAIVHFRQRDYLDDLAMEGGDDFLWRCGWNEDPNPTVALDVRITDFSHRWNIGH